MIHNEVKRQGAKRASTPMWRPLDKGVMHLSMEALYLQSDQGVLPWAYDGIDYAHMISRSVLEFGGTADSRNLFNTGSHQHGLNLPSYSGRWLARFPTLNY
jgi:hypothetical protein